jgi:hypothetical protein
MTVREHADLEARQYGGTAVSKAWRLASGVAVAVLALSAAPGLAHASPGCQALNGTKGPAFADTGNDMATGFRAGDFITLNLVVASSDILQLYDQTASTFLTSQLTSPGTLTYTVPADTSNMLRIWYSAGPTTEITWSCVSVPEPQPELEPTTDDSQKLRSLQKSGTKAGSLTAGSAYSGMIGDAISSGIAGGSPAQSTSGTPPGASGLGMGERREADVVSGRRARLMPWVNGRFSESGDDNNVDWQHKTIAGGASYAVAPGLIVGAFGGYEKLDFDQKSNVSGRLDGNGGTAGIYAAWMLAPKLRLDGAIARTWLDYSSTAGTAQGDFDGSRWLFLTRLSGDHVAGRWTYTPSAEVFWLRESQDAYTDSLGTAQAKNSFTNGRANAGLQAAYAIPLSQRTTLSPYAGIYADYYFGMEDDGTALPVIGIGDGWAARATGGLTLSGVEGWALTLGAEAGNLGGEGPEFWTGRLGGSVQF